MKARDALRVYEKKRNGISACHLGAFEQVSCVTEKTLLTGDASESRNLN